MKISLLFIISFFCLTGAWAQFSHEDRFHKADSVQSQPKPEKGPNHGKMLKNNGLKVEMVIPSNVKKPEVSYFIFDTLSTPLEAKSYTGTVKYVFGGPNQYIEVNLIPSGKNNQYVATLEDWKDCKSTIVTLKENGKVKSTVVFYNTIVQASKTHDDGGGGGGRGNGMGGGGLGGQGRQNGGGMYQGNNGMR